MTRKLSMLSLAAFSVCAWLPGSAAAVDTQIEVPLTVPRTGNITVATAHTRLQGDAGTVRVTLKRGQKLPKGVSLYARPQRQGMKVTVTLVLTNNASTGTRALATARRTAILNAPRGSNFSRSFSADEQSNVFSLDPSTKPDGKICDGKGSGTSRLIAGKHVFSSTDAGQVIKASCAAFDGKRTGSAKQLQDELQG